MKEDIKNKENAATNEFDQVVVGNSLTKDAWKRLRKNKMAVVGMVIVILYALISAFAPLLPLHDYDEIILDHQNLGPSFNKTAGELMMENKKKELYFKAWKDGSLVLTEEQSALIVSWIDESKTNSVWNLCLEEGEKQLAAGTFTWSSSDQKTLDKLQKKIDEDIFVDITKIYQGDTNLKKLDSDSLAKVYATMIGLDDTTLILEQTYKEMDAFVFNTIEMDADVKKNLSDEEKATIIDKEIEKLGDAYFEEKLAENLYGKINAQVLRDVTKILENESEEGTISFPYKDTIEVDGLTITVSSSLVNQRHYLLGTDYSGRDLLSRIIYGGQISIMIGIIGTLFSVFIGIVLGALAGYLGGKVDYIIMRIVDVMYGLPYMLIVIICMAIFGRSILNLFIALGIVSWLTIARMVRGQIMSLKNSEYVEAARSMGAKTWRIIFKHMIPNSLSIIIVYSTLRIPSFIMQESFLSFLGLGVQAPMASWGSLISNGVASMTIYPWRLIFPSIAMTLFLFAMNFFGDGLRDAFDPQSKNQL
ncbi:MAG: ABC transporter permease [Sphaerochaetaceae bacterium]|nr:ABC transporter permease [Sphaerochaetaceae bacterium]MDC7250135.1 ABC transporter permease [Sphaerochaetaceae bacterium]